MTGLCELADRAAALTRPCREVDAAIHAMRLPPDTPNIPEYAPAYTSSIDIAMALVPEGWAVSVLRWSGGEGRSAVWLDMVADEEVHAATPAIALTAAALRALAIHPHKG